MFDPIVPVSTILCRVLNRVTTLDLVESDNRTMST